MKDDKNNDEVTPISFETDIAPMFTARDVTCMNPRNVKLTDFVYMSDPAGDETHADHAHARHVYARLTGDEKPQMPRGGGEKFWTDPTNPQGQKNLETFNAWMTNEPPFQP